MKCNILLSRVMCKHFGGFDKVILLTGNKFHDKKIL